MSDRDTIPNQDEDTGFQDQPAVTEQETETTKEDDTNVNDAA